MGQCGGKNTVDGDYSEQIKDFFPKKAGKLVEKKS